jgi:crossover junction endodeoxyribonuclease RusA
MEIELPYPPSVNHYWRNVKGHMTISKAGKAFRGRARAICLAMGLQCVQERIRLDIEAFPPDKRSRDIDNLLKAPLDALGKGFLYNDDSQIDEIHLHRRECFPNGKLLVRVTPLVGGEVSSSDDVIHELRNKLSDLDKERAELMEVLAMLEGEGEQAQRSPGPPMGVGPS